MNSIVAHLHCGAKAKCRKWATHMVSLMETLKHFWVKLIVLRHFYETHGVQSSQTMQCPVCLQDSRADYGLHPLHLPWWRHRHEQQMRGHWILSESPHWQSLVDSHTNCAAGWEMCGCWCQSQKVPRPKLPPVDLHHQSTDLLRCRSNPGGLCKTHVGWWTVLFQCCVLRPAVQTIGQLGLVTN